MKENEYLEMYDLFYAIYQELRRMNKLKKIQLAKELKVSDSYLDRKMQEVKKK